MGASPMPKATPVAYLGDRPYTVVDGTNPVRNRNVPLDVPIGAGAKGEWRSTSHLFFRDFLRYYAMFFMNQFPFCCVY